MHFTGTLGEIRETVTAARDGLAHLNTLGEHLRWGLRGLADTQYGQEYDDYGDPIYDSALLPTLVSSVTNPANGTTTNKYSDGSATIYDANGNDVTANFIGTAPQPQGAVSNAITSIGQSVTDLPSTITSAAGTVVGAVAGIATPLIVIGAIGLAVYYFAKKA